MMYLKKIIIWFLKFLLFLIVFAGFVAFAVSAVITVVPNPSASKTNMIGYKSNCPFVPISTTILVTIALVFGFIFMKIYGKKILQIVSALARETITEMAK